jgi:hypothetical protein
VQSVFTCIYSLLQVMNWEKICSCILVNLVCVCVCVCGLTLVACVFHSCEPEGVVWFALICFEGVRGTWVMCL